MAYVGKLIRKSVYFNLYFNMSVDLCLQIMFIKHKHIEIICLFDFLYFKTRSNLLKDKNHLICL